MKISSTKQRVSNIRMTPNIHLELDVCLRLTYRLLDTCELLWHLKRCKYVSPNLALIVVQRNS